MLKQTFKIILKNKKVILPFFLLALFEGIALYLIYLSPQDPVSKLLAPPIKKFLGEQYLHYPYNLVIMQKIFNNVLIWLNCFPGMIFNGMVIIFTCNALNKEPIKFRSTFVKTLKKIIPLAVIWTSSYYLAKYSNYIMPFLSKKLGLAGMPFIVETSKVLIKYHLPHLLIIVSYIISFLAQILLLFSIPLILVNHDNIFKAFILNFKYLFKLLPKTIAVFLFSALLFFPIMVAKQNMTLLMKKFFMEVPVVVLSIEIICLLLLNLLITVSTTVIWHKKNQEIKGK